jgi:hypothetical protein
MPMAQSQGEKIYLALFVAILPQTILFIQEFAARVAYTS